MSGSRILEVGPASLCSHCGQPADSLTFDDSGVAAVPGLGQEVILARFELPAQYCGRLEYFSQYSDVQARNPARIETPGLEWAILMNRSPLHPFLRLDHIVNPWGFGSFPVSLRLDEGALLEFVVRRVGPEEEPSSRESRRERVRRSESATTRVGRRRIRRVESRLERVQREESDVSEIRRVGGRIVGRYWYNRSYGHADPRA